ncbi:unnamed protein product [Psylliodes chrysocephalus]|uniref:N-acetyltransferase domain-containing protein n=1 Tax=Psylliodes chrysocephalus TaxID=3402493 RepID=A0A9P0D6Y4_9CUCU|nr:unnamed protein product [Psylliodes chrysocephala]
MVSRCRRLIREKERIFAETDTSGEQDFLGMLREKAASPITWNESIPGIKIQDLQPKRFNDAMDCIISDGIPVDIIYKSTNILDDPESMEAFQEKMLFLMKDRTSIIAVNDENEIVGVLVMKAVRKYDYSKMFSKLQIRRGKTFLIVMRFINNIYKEVDIFQQFQCEIYLRFYFICVKQTYRKRKIGNLLMWTGLDVARHLKINVMMGLFPAAKLQSTAHMMGMDVLRHYFFSSWHDKTESLVFRGIGGGNYSCALMAGYVKDIKADDERK